MSVSISSVITGSFIKQFDKASSKSSLKDALSGNTSNSVDYVTTLQSGASVYSKAIRTVSSVAGYVNLAVSNLTELGELTDKLIDIAEKATKATSSSTLKNLNREFQSLAKEFNKIVKNAKYDDHEYLAKEDLEELFKSVGLDPDNARDLANIFDDFIIADKDNNKLLVSDATKPRKYSQIPTSAFKTTINKPDEFEVNKITNPSAGVTNTNSLISNVNSVTQSETAGTTSITVKSLIDDSETSAAFSTETNLKTINARSGYSVIESSDNLIGGQNPSGYKQLFLLNENGEAIHQITNFEEDVTFGEVSISDDGKKVLYGYNVNDETILKDATYSNFGDNPLLNTEREIERIDSDSADDIKSINVSSDGSSYAFLVKNGEIWDANLKDSATLTSDATLLAKDDITSIGFVDTNSVAFLSGNAGSQKISTYENGSGSIVDISTGLNINNFKVLEKSSFDNSYISYNSNDSSTLNDLSVINESGESVFTKEIDDSDIISNISLRNNEVGSASVGVFGAINTSEDPNEELYEYGYVNNSKVIKYSTAVSRPLKLLNSSFKLSNRASGYVALDDLKAMRKQIDTNLKKLDETLDYMQKNVDLARATGLAMLEVSYDVQSYDDAESLAKKLRKEILKTAPNLLDQVHNLDPMATAAILYELESK